ncbi:hypothetical protein GCM10009740_16150 [Terrabacter terrae]|uniref:Uncharacterized protein n=1 Tax=Terrabacter terrae TaxID=318434 RepID=A0ABN2U225_9MICO
MALADRVGADRVKRWAARSLLHDHDRDGGHHGENDRYDTAPEKERAASFLALLRGGHPGGTLAAFLAVRTAIVLGRKHETSGAGAGTAPSRAPAGSRELVVLHLAHPVRTVGSTTWSRYRNI